MPPIMEHIRRREWVEFVALLCMVAMITIYSAVRYGSLWGENDTYSRANDVLIVLDAGRLIPGDNEPVYPNGFGFQSIAVFLVNLSGVGIGQLQIYVSALLVVWIVVPAWLAYRELTGSVRGATLAAVLLFAQPEFLFMVIRGTHEKFTRGLMLICIYLLARSLRGQYRVSLATGFVLTFHMAAFTIVALNNLLANSFIVALGLGLVLCWLLARRKGSAPVVADVAGRLALVSITALIFVYLITFHLYPPAQHDLVIVQSIVDRLASLFLDVQKESTNPYSTLGGDWVSLPVYITFSLANWLLLGLSAVIWLVRSYSWLRGRWRPRDPGELLLWALYAAFGFQGALGLLSDLSGAIAGTLQHRIFPSISMLAAPLVARFLLDWQPRKAMARRMVKVMLVGGVAVLAGLSIVKATNEPMINNKWKFYIPAESQALDWAEVPLAKRYIWIERDERLLAGIYTRTEYAQRQTRFDQFEPEPGTRDFLISTVTLARSERQGAVLPIESDSLVTYDNGPAQIYHLRPRTPYQR